MADSNGNEHMVSHTATAAQCYILIPTAKTDRFPARLESLLQGCRRKFGGHPFATRTGGARLERAADGVAGDYYTVVAIGIPDLAYFRTTLNDLVAQVANDLGELSIFVAFEGGATYFVWARSTSGLADLAASPTTSG